MELTGRLTADARVSKVTDGREVTNFIVVMNDNYKDKEGKRKEVNTFLRCAYWVSPKVAPYLKKGVIVSVYGRIGLDVYKDSAGDVKGSLTFHVNNIRFVAAAPKPQAAANVPAGQTTDDLPF